MNPRFVRRRSCIEALFTDFHDTGLNMTFRYYLRLDRMPQVSILEQMLGDALVAHPDVNLRLHKGAWYRSDFLPPCDTREVGADVCEDAPDRLDFRKHTLAMHLLHTPSDDWYLAFDFFHGVVDGRSALHFLYGFFRAEGVATEASDGSLTHVSLLPGREAGRRPFRVPWMPLVRAKDWQPRAKGSYRTVSVTGAACPRGASERLTRRVGACFCGKRATTVIPIDLRPFGQKDVFLLGNLILPVLTDPFRYEQGQLQSRLREDARDWALHAGTSAGIAFYGRLPRWLTRMGLRMTMPIFQRIPRFVCAGVVSPVGTVAHQRLRCPHFAAVDMLAAFTATPLNAFTVVSLQFDGHSSTTVSWHSGRVPDHVARKLADVLAEGSAKMT